MWLSFYRWFALLAWDDAHGDSVECHTLVSHDDYIPKDGDHVMTYVPIE